MFRFLFFGLLLHLYLFHCTDGQLEEYFRWKQITFAAVEKGKKKLFFIWKKKENFILENKILVIVFILTFLIIVTKF